MMTAPFSQDLRERVAGVIAGGSSAREAARRFEISPSAAIKLMQRVRETGSTRPAKIGGYRRPLLEGQADYLSNLRLSVRQKRLELTAEHGAV